jgi:hypothetical protein
MRKMASCYARQMADALVTAPCGCSNANQKWRMVVFMNKIMNLMLAKTLSFCYGSKLASALVFVRKEECTCEAH